MHPTRHTSESNRADSADSLPLLHTTAATSASSPNGLVIVDATSTWDTVQLAKSSRTAPSAAKPPSDWSHPLAALERQRESARRAYTPFTVAAAEVVAARRAEQVAQDVVFTIQDDCRTPQMLLPPLASESGVGLGRLLTAPSRLSRPFSAINDVAPPSVSSPNFHERPPSGKSTNRPDAATLPISGLAAGKLGLAPLPPRTSASANLLRPTSANEAPARPRRSTTTSSPFTTEQHLPDRTIADHYTHLSHLLRGYGGDDVAEEREEREDAWQLDHLKRRSRGSSGSAGQGGPVPVARTFPVASHVARTSSPAVSAATVSGDLFRQFVEQQRHTAPRASPPTKADASRFQRHLRRYLSRQLSSLLQYEESERAQLQSDAFRALRTLLGLHGRFCDYIELRARQAAAMAALQANERELRTAYPVASSLGCLQTSAKAAEDSMELGSTEQAALTGSEGYGRDDSGVFEELKVSFGAEAKMLACHDAALEELKVGAEDVRACVADLQERFEALMPKLDFDLLEASATTSTKVAPPHEPFEQLLPDGDSRDGLIALQESFEELVALPDEETLVESAEIPAWEEVQDDQSSGVRSDSADRSGLLCSKEATEEEFEELAAPPDYAEAEICAGLEGSTPEPFEELEASATTFTKVDLLSGPFAELLAGDATSAAVAALQETFEGLSLLLCFVELEVHDAAPAELPAPLDPFEELVDTPLNEDGTDVAPQETYEELFPKFDSMLVEVAEGSEQELPSLPDVFEELLESPNTHTKVAPPPEPFTELEEKADTNIEHVALREVFEELLLTQPFEELEASAGTHARVLPSSEPFELLVEAAKVVYADVLDDAVAMREVFEELVVPVRAEAVCADRMTELPSPTSSQTFVELKVRPWTHTKVSLPDELFQSLETSLGTVADILALQEGYEELVWTSPSLTEPSASLAAGSDVSFVTPASFSESPVDELVESEEEPSTTGYRVGIPEVVADENGVVQQVTCTFNDLSLDGFASTELGDVFAEACGVRRPVAVACRQFIGGADWCAHLACCGAAIRSCLLADVCATLECAAVRVRNVVLSATAPAPLQDGETRSQDTASEHHTDASVGGTGLTVCFDVINETGFALYPQDDMQYLIRESNFPFVQQWRRSRAALVQIENHRRSSPLPGRRPLLKDSGATSPQGAGLQLWAYSTESTRRVRKPLPKLPSARLSFSPGFHRATSNLLLGVPDQMGNDAAEAADARQTSPAAPQPSSPRQPVIQVLAVTKMGLASPVEMADGDASVAHLSETAEVSPADASTALPPQLQRPH